MERASKSVAGFAVLLSGGWWGGEPPGGALGTSAPSQCSQRKEPSAPGVRPTGVGTRCPRNLVGLRDGGGSHPELDPPSSRRDRNRDQS